MNDHPDKKRKIPDITSDDQKSIQQTAVANAMMIIWRPINPDASSKLSKQGIIGKGLNIKAKSSTFGPISGDIPYDVRLSKIWDKGNDAVIHAQEKLDQQLQKDEKAEQEFSPKEGKEQSFDINKYNDQLLVTKIVKTFKVGDQNETIYYFCDGNTGSIIFDTNKEPWFAVKEDTAKEGTAEKKDAEQFKFYNISTKKFDLTSKDANEQNSWRSKSVEILAYRQYEKVGDKLQENLCPITADYDELVSATAKFYPFENNSEIVTTFSRELYKNLSNHQSPENIAAELILRHEQAVKEENRQVRNDKMQPFMGLVNDWQRAFKNILKLDTNAHTNHGPEVNNPFPEPFSRNGRYAVFYPDKNAETKELDENGVCDFINECRKNGFPLDVNSRWGWEVNQKTGELFVPAQENKFDWKEVEEGIAVIGQKMATLDEDRRELLQAYNLENTDLNTAILLNAGANNFPTLISLILSANKETTINHQFDNIIKDLVFIKKGVEIEEKEQENVIDLSKNAVFLQYDNLLNTQNNLSKYILRFHEENQIRDLKLKIEKLKLEPDLVYYQGAIVPPDQPARVIFDSKEKDFSQKVMELVREKEHQERWEKIGKAEKELSQKIQKYKKKYKSKSLVAAEITKHEKVIDQEEEIIDQAMEQKSEQKNLVFKN